MGKYLYEDIVIIWLMFTSISFLFLQVNPGPATHESGK